ncbi:MAG: hypothetical protein Greene101449_1221 [Candidatus Peregrinibacteria bacterium Greene1014_49]|nr:MAG: hypothetical protein Greene101449_1221 [Candidatus Peregrinibacteria bacterium Greene1014_49]
MEQQIRHVENRWLETYQPMFDLKAQEAERRIDLRFEDPKNGERKWREKIFASADFR